MPEGERPESTICKGGSYRAREEAEKQGYSGGHSGGGGEHDRKKIVINCKKVRPNTSPSKKY